jgi:hypothetical protein
VKQPFIAQVIDISSSIWLSGVSCDADKQKLGKGDAISHEKSIFSISEDRKRRFWPNFN